MCDHLKNSKSQVGGSFGGWENLAFCWKHYFQQKNCRKCVIIENFSLSPKMLS